MTILIFLIILGLLILSHEFGHFFVAKRSGARVDEFGLGFPPRLISWRRGETTYSLNLIPFGGFVKIYGEDPNEESLTGTDRQRAFSAQSKWVQTSILVAGVTANLVLAWLLLVVAFATTGLPTQADSVPQGYTLDNPRVTIIQVAPNSPAAVAELILGDQIVKLRTTTDYLTEPTIESIQDFITNHSNSEIIVSYIRTHGPNIKPTIAERAVKPANIGPEGKLAIGVGLETIGILQLPLHRAIIAGTQSTWHLVSSTVTAFGSLLISFFRGQSEVLGQITGPVGLVGLVGDASALGFGYLLLFTALISINLAVLNLLPIPALDGGRLLFLLIERIKGRAIKPQVANAVNLTGFLLLMILMLLVTYSDIMKFFA
ncbi:MAG TPA: site-2 protease family protein [Candidatus Paceibacterota bacterium]